MAKDKKSFILYTDLIHTVKKMPMDKRGELFTHILEYVNDENPNTNDIMIELVFEPIKQSLNRDLEKYKKIIERNKANGKKGGRPKKETQQNPNKPSGLNNNPDNPVGLSETQQNPIEPKKADSDTGNGIESDTEIDVKEIDTPKGDVPKATVFFFKKELKALGVENQLADDWIKVRKLKKAANTKTAFDALVKEFDKSGLKPNDCVKMAVENSWSGFKALWLKNQSNNNNNQQGTLQNPNDLWESRKK